MNGLKSDKQSLDADNADLRKLIETEKGSIVGLESEVQRLKTLLNNYESTKSELVSKLQSISKEKVSEERDNTDLHAELKHLKAEILTKDQEIEDQRRSIIDLDQRYDSLVHQLDMKTEELSRTQQNLEFQHSEFAQTRQQVSLATSKEEGYSQRLTERETEVADLRHRLNVTLAELEDLRKMDAIRSTDSDHLIQDL